MGKPQFDPNQPFEVVSDGKPKFDPSQPFERADNPSLLDRYKTWETGLEDNLKAGALGAAKWGGYGTAPVIAGAGNAAYGAAQNLFTGDEINSDTIKRDYLKGRDGLDAATEKAWKEHPYAYGAGAAVGGFYSPINKILAPIGALQKWGKLGTTATTALLPAEKAAAQGLGRLGSAGINMAVHGADGAVAGAVMDPGNKPGVIDPLQLDKRGESAAWGAGIGAGLTGGVEGVKAGWKKGMTTFFPPSAEGIEGYLENRERINSAPTVENIKDSVDQQVGGLRSNVAENRSSIAQTQQALANAKLEGKYAISQTQLDLANARSAGKDSISQTQQALANARSAGKDSISQTQQALANAQAEGKQRISDTKAALSEAVANGRMTVQQAQSALDALTNDVKRKARDAATEFSQSLPDMRQSVADAKQALVQQQGALESGLSSVPHPREMAPDVHQAVGTLKDQVVAESQASRNILANSNIGVATQPVVQAVDAAIKDHLIAGQEPITASGQAALARLRSLKDSLSKYPGMLSGEDAKRFVQQIDQEAKYVNDSGGFSDSYSNALKDVRRSVDTQLKGYQPYEDQMKIVAEKTGLLNKANKAFGTPEKAHGAMNTIAGEGKAPQQELLQELGVHTGNDFATPLAKYQKAQDTLKNGMAPLVENLPGQKAVRDGQSIAEIAPYLKNNYVDHVLQESGLPAQKAAQEAHVASLQSTPWGAEHAAELERLKATQFGAEHAAELERLKGTNFGADHAAELERLKATQFGAEHAAELERLKATNFGAEHQAELDRLQGELAKSKKALDPFKQWQQETSQNRIQALISKAPGNESIEARRQLEALDQLRNRSEGTPSYLQSIEDNRIRKQFEGGKTQGSRLVNMGHAVGTAIGAAVGAVIPGAHAVLVPALSAAGAVTGGYVDKQGGKLAKGILDHYLDNPELYKQLSNPRTNRVVAPWLMMRKDDK